MSDNVSENTEWRCQLNETLNEHTIGKQVYALVFIDSVVCILAITGNVLVILSVIRFPKLRTTTNMFVVSLASADLLVGISIPYYILFYFHGYPGFDWTCDPIPCLVRYFTILNTTITSMLSLIGVAVDRYLAIIYPFSYPQILYGNRWILAFIIAGWIYVILICGFPLIFYNTWSKECVNNCVQGTIECDLFYIADAKYALCVVGIHVGITLVVTISLYVRIFREACRQARAVACLELNPRFHKEARAAKMMALVLSACFLGLAPYLFAITYPYSRDREELKTDLKWWSIYKKFAVCFYLGNSSINPFIYGWKNTEFRSAFLQLLHFLYKDCRSPTPIRELQTPSHIVVGNNFQ